jgi:hypothetical protein
MQVQNIPYSPATGNVFSSMNTRHNLKNMSAQISKQKKPATQYSSLAQRLSEYNDH